jgi:ABC-type phosphate/phosphonate transport system permease subunit
LHISASPILSVGDPYQTVILTRSLLGKVHLGEITRTSSYFPRPERIAALPEEALAAVPGSMREGSYACGASKWQTIRRIVLPRAMPGIMTGAILAMARGAARWHR